MISVSRLFAFDAAHRVLGHKGKCRHLHGHRWQVEVTLAPSLLAPDLDALGMVLDFAEIKARIGAWIEETFDHNILLHVSDPLAKLWQRGERADLGSGLTVADLFGSGKQPCLLDCNPTAENLAQLIHVRSRVLLHGLPVAVQQVRVWETPNCAATHVA